MSTTGNRRLPRARKEAMQVLANRPMSGDKEALIAYSVNAARVIGSPGYPSAEDRLQARVRADFERGRSEEHTSELQSLMRISYAVFCLNKKNTTNRVHKQ